MRRFSIPAIAMVALTLTACDAPTSTGPGAPPSLAKTKINEWVVVTPTTITDPCSGEEILVSGKGHITQMITENDDGSYRSHAHINYAGISGYGLTNGLKYNLVATQQQREAGDLVGNAGSVKTQVGLVSQGPTDNYKGRLVVEYGFDGTDSYYITVKSSETCGNEEL